MINRIVIAKYKTLLYKYIFAEVKCNFKRLIIGPEIAFGFQIMHPRNLEIGDYTVINGDCLINAYGGVKIGRYCHIGKGLTIYSHNHNWKSEKSIPYDDLDIAMPVLIGDAVWIGANVSMAPGSSVGDGCVIAIGSVLFDNFPECAIILGNPAKVVGYRDKNIFYKLYSEGMFS